MKEFIRMWSRSPLTTINPFPRFAFANALPFVLEHSPLGYLKAFSPKVLEALASGHPERFAKAASRATIGTLMFESAWHVRQSKYAGEKWYEIKVGKPDPKTGKQKMIDMRAYAPLSTPFFLAELFIDLTRPEEERRMDAKDLAEAAIGLNRIAGSGLVFVDLLKTKKIESAKDLLSRFLGAYIGSYSVTAKTAKDIIAGTIDPEEAIYRDTKQNPVIAPFLQNIPFVSKLLPEAVSPITADRVRAISPAQRQLTGLTVKYKLPIHQEIDKLNISWSMIYPTTGIKEADREIAKKMGPMTDAYAPSVILTNPAYTEGSPTKKRILLKTFFKAIRQEAKEKMKITHPRLMGKIAIGGIGYDEKKYFKEQTGIDLNKLFE